jgi:hypothetical protein
MVIAPDFGRAMGETIDDLKGKTIGHIDEPSHAKKQPAPCRIGI